MNRMDCAEHICRIVAEQCAAAADLLEALNQEKQALAGRDAQSLAGAAARKQVALRTIERLEGERRRMAQALGHGSTAEDMQRLVGRLEAEMPHAALVGDLKVRWSSLCGALRRCREANALNGQVVTTLQRRVQQALNLLRGGRGEVATYGRTGSTQLSGVAARALGRV